ncbi:hypothetical protein FI667_g12751, partial [Globisporangium splendens]
MKLTSIVLSCAALACSVLSANAQDKPLPWDGRGEDLTVKTLTSKYMTHILTMRKNSTTADPAKYVSINQKGRSPAYNDDTGVINIAVDKDAVFKTQNNFRRSELVQMIEANTAGKTFFRASVKKDEAFLNKYQWQIIFPETHIFEIRIDAAMNPPKIIYLNNGTWDAKWETEFQTKTWYNFGIAVSKPASGSGSHLEFYTSEGNAELKLAATHTTVTEFPSNYEFHYGMLTLSDDGSDPVMAAKQDILSFNGVSVEKSVSVGGSAASAAGDDSATGDDASAADDSAASASAPAPASTPATTPKACKKKN